MAEVKAGCALLVMHFYSEKVGHRVINLSGPSFFLGYIKYSIQSDAAQSAPAQATLKHTLPSSKRGPQKS